MAETLITHKLSVMSRRAELRQSAVAVVAVAGRAQGLRRVLKAVRQACHRCRTSNSALGALTALWGSEHDRTLFSISHLRH